MTVCHYCGEEYEITTDLEESYASNDDEHNVCSSCLFEVIANDAEIEPLPEFVEDDDREVATDGGRDLNGHWINDDETWCPECQRYRISCAHVGGEQR